MYSRVLFFKGIRKSTTARRPSLIASALQHGENPVYHAGDVLLKAAIIQMSRYEWVPEIEPADAAACS